MAKQQKDHGTSAKTARHEVHGTHGTPLSSNKSVVVGSRVCDRSTHFAFSHVRLSSRPLFLNCSFLYRRKIMCSVIVSLRCFFFSYCEKNATRACRSAALLV